MPRRLNQPEIVKTCRWLDTHWATIVAEQWTQVRAAREASKDLGFPLFDTHIANMARSQEREWPTPLSEIRRKEQTSRSEMTRAIDTLCQIVGDLHERLAEPVPPELDVLLQHAALRRRKPPATPPT